MEEFNEQEEIEKIKKQKELRNQELENIQAQAYGKAKAESETNAVSTIVQDPQKAVKTKLSEKLINSLDDASVDEKVGNTAKILVDKGLEEQENLAQADVINSEDATLVADFNKNKEEYLYHGIDHKIDKKWKRNMLLFINDIWFVIWAIIGCFTIVPVSTFLSRIKALSGFMRVVAIIVGVVLLLGCLTGITFSILKWSGIIS